MQHKSVPEFWSFTGFSIGHQALQHLFIHYDRIHYVGNNYLRLIYDHYSGLTAKFLDTLEHTATVVRRAEHAVSIR